MCAQRNAVGRSLEILFEFLLTQLSKYDECFLKKQSRLVQDSINIVKAIHEDAIFQERRPDMRDAPLKDVMRARMKVAGPAAAAVGPAAPFRRADGRLRVAESGRGALPAARGGSEPGNR